MSLTEEKRAELRDLTRANLPVKADGSIDLIARAWAVRGTKCVILIDQKGKLWPVGQKSPFSIS